MVLALLLCAVDAKKPKNTTEIHVDDPVSGALNPGETLLYWYNARTDSTALFFRLKYPPLPELDTDIQMIARFSADLWQPPVTTANCSVGECSIELRVFSAFLSHPRTHDCRAGPSQHHILRRWQAQVEQILGPGLPVGHRCV